MNEVLLKMHDIGLTPSSTDLLLDYVVGEYRGKCWGGREGGRAGFGVEW